MSVCVEVSEPKSCPLFPAVLTAGLVTLVQISRVLPLLLSPAAQDCRGQPSCTGTSTLLTAHCTLCSCIITMIIMVLVCLAWTWCVVLRWTVCLQARDVSVVRVTAGGLPRPAQWWRRLTSSGLSIGGGGQQPTWRWPVRKPVRDLWWGHDSLH